MRLLYEISYKLAGKELTPFSHESGYRKDS